MTYCLGIMVEDGLVMASDSRTNAGLDNVNLCRKMHIFEVTDERVFVILTSGSLSLTPSVVTPLQRDPDAGRCRSGRGAGRRRAARRAGAGRGGGAAGAGAGGGGGGRGAGGGGGGGAGGAGRGGGGVVGGLARGRGGEPRPRRRAE